MKKQVFLIMGIIGLLLLQMPIQPADDITSMVIYGKATYDGTGIDEIPVTINLSYNDTVYDVATKTTYGGGKYQIDLDNMDISWNSSMTVTVSTTYSGESDSNTFTLTTARTNDGMHESNLVLTSSSGDDDDDNDDNGSSSGDDDDSTTTGGSNSTTYLVTIGGILVFAFIFGLAFFLFGNQPSMSMPQKKKVTKKSYVKSGIQMEEYSNKSKNNRRKR